MREARHGIAGLSATGNDQAAASQRLDDVQLAGGTQARAVRRPMVIGMRTGGHMRDAPLDREPADGGQNRVFAEITAVARIGAVARDIELGNVDLDQFRAELGRDLPRGNEFRTGEAWRVGDRGQHAMRG
jgi:hypothetical protein